MAHLALPQVIAEEITQSARIVHERLVAAGLLAVDIVALVVAFSLAGIVRFANPLLPYFGPFSLSFYERLVLWVIPIYLMLFATNHLYDVHELFGGTREYGRVVNGCTFGVMVVILYNFLDRSEDVTVSRGWLLAAWLLTICVVTGGRGLRS